MNITEALNSTPCDQYLRHRLCEYIIDKYFFISCAPIGKSVLGRTIECYTIGNKPKKALLCGAFHGMEWITASLLYTFIINISEAIINHKPLANEKIWELLSERSLCVIPCVNPDGVEISINGSGSAGELKDYVELVSDGDTLHWQSNALGVDLNHNFNADWESVKKKEIAMGITSPSKTRYGGERPESEAETIALTKFCRSNKICSAIAFHSQGEEIYWDFGCRTPECSLELAQDMAELSGYTVAQPEDIATGGGFKDWVIEELGVPAFTVEVGKGENPLDISQLSDIYNKTEGIMVKSLIM